MEKDKLSLLWQDIAPAQKSQEDLSKMFKERSNPVLKSIRKQILIEFLGFGAFLFCYYSMFDGADKPLFVNIMITFAILAPILHHVKCYQLQKQFKSGHNLKEDLTDFVAKLKTFRIETLIARVLFISGMLLFFTYNIHFSANKWWALVIIITSFSIQLFFLYKVWSNRIYKIKLVLQEFSTSVD
ncbi:MAG: hypothetical protein EOO98_00855 [Pedobacter sp.]|nr:MAG: hypothetical protein EOO98_00855 [Pedobacter sp.]